jgi:hypothetical protein
MTGSVRDLLGDIEEWPLPAALDALSVTSLRRRLWAMGYPPLAIYTREKRPAGNAWQERARRDPPEATTLPADAAALNTGVLCDRLRVVDIDLEDAAIAGQIEAIAFDMLGAAPVRSRGNSAKRAIFYRAAEGEPRKRIRSGAAGKVEVLGHGQQVHVFGLHPSGAALRWRPAPLDAVPRADLPAVTEKALTAFLAAVAPLIGANPGAVDSAGIGDRATTDQAALAAPSLEILADALQHVPNHGDREAWIRVGHAIKAAGGTVEMWEAWSNRWGGPPEDPDDLARRFDGFRPPFLAGWRTIERAAREASGWVGGVAADFAPVLAQLRADADAEAAAVRVGTFGRLRLRTVADAEHAPRRDYLVKPLLARGELSAWWGAPKAGKSFLVLRLAWCIALGRDFPGFKVKRARRVLYVAAEGEGGFTGRIQALRRDLGDTGDLFRFIAQPVTLGPPANDLSDLVEAARGMVADLIVVDTLARTFGAGDENTAQDMGRFVANLDRLREETGAHVLVIHHGRKDGGDLRGSGALAGAADLIVKVEKGAGAEPSVATIEAAKDDADGRSFAFRLRRVDLGVDEDGDPRWTCIADPSVAPVTPLTKLPKAAAAVLAILADLAAAEGEAPPDIDTCGARAIPDARLRQECDSRRVSTAEKATDRARVVRQAIADLREAGRIGMRNDWVWPAGTAA